MTKAKCSARFEQQRCVFVAGHDGAHHVEPDTWWWDAQFMPTPEENKEWRPSLHELARKEAQREANQANADASWARERPSVKIGRKDVTEMVVSLLDALMGSLDAGSGFLDDDTERAMEELSTLLKFDSREAWRAKYRGDE